MGGIIGERMRRGATSEGHYLLCEGWSVSRQPALESRLMELTAFFAERSRGRRAEVVEFHKMDFRPVCRIVHYAGKDASVLDCTGQVIRLCNSTKRASLELRIEELRLAPSRARI